MRTISVDEALDLLAGGVRDPLAGVNDSLADSIEHEQGCVFYALVCLIVTVGIPLLLLAYAVLFWASDGIWPWQ